VAKRGTPGWRGYATAVALTATVVLLCVAINSWMDGPPILISITQAVIAGGTLLVLIFVALALFAIRRDFAGRELAEADLDRFFSLSFDFLTIASADGYFKRVSPASQELLGWTPEELTDKPWLAFVHPDDVESTIREAEKLKAGQRVLSFENRYRHKDGSWRVLSWRSTPEGHRFFGIARDVTDETRTKQELRDAKEQLEARVAERTRELEQANTALQHAYDDLRQTQEQVMQQHDALQAARTELARVSRLTTLGEMTTSIAHEVSQPLGGMLTSAGACARWLATDPPAMAEAQAALANIVADGKRAREVIARIRALSKRQAPRKDWLDINQEIMGVLALTEREIPPREMMAIAHENEEVRSGAVCLFRPGHRDNAAHVLDQARLIGQLASHTTGQFVVPLFTRRKIAALYHKIFYGATEGGRVERAGGSKV